MPIVDITKGNFSETGSTVAAETIEFTELRTFAVRCGPTQHDYWQGMIAHEDLLFCRNCADVVTFALPRGIGGGR